MHSWFKPDFPDILILLAGVGLGLSTNTTLIGYKLLYLAAATALVIYAKFIRKAENEKNRP